MKQPRRRFLQAAAAGAALPCSPEAEAAAAAADSTPAVLSEGPPITLPKIKLGQHQVSRLIVGGNPFYGYSHFNRLFSQHMTEWATSERICQVLEHGERCGINTWQFSHTARTMSDLAAHRARGGKMNWILLSHAEMENDHSLVKDVVKHKPVGIVHHGGSAERKRRQGQLGQVRDFLKSVRDSGVLVGLSCHDPSLLEQVESEGWDIDFYMTSLYYLTRSNEEWQQLLGTRPLGEVYVPEDPAKMYKVIRQTKRPCLCYKVLAAGRATDSPAAIDKAFQSAYSNIKPTDALIIGMYPRYFDQVRDNAQRVNRLLNRG
ncbi:MAG: hypothetical protein FJW20_07285 [Acidimicrobiia bacterium]|nr:hypothetical protein [Acidimicrobiia bacterium]